MAVKSQKSKTDNKTLIVEAYKDFVLTQGKEPASVYAFAKELKMPESEFYAHFNHFSEIDTFVWSNAVQSVIQALKDSKEISDYTAREKLLGFFYTLLEVLNKERSYFSYSLKAHRPLFMKHHGIRPLIEDYAKELMREGITSNEIEDRRFLSDRYHEAVWLNTMFILNFWMDDDSVGFEKTDAAIEKSVNLVMELLGKSALDNFMDLGKFLMQNQKFPNFKF